MLLNGATVQLEMFMPLKHVLGEYATDVTSNAVLRLHHSMQLGRLLVCSLACLTPHPATPAQLKLITRKCMHYLQYSAQNDTPSHTYFHT